MAMPPCITEAVAFCDTLLRKKGDFFAEPSACVLVLL